MKRLPQKWTALLFAGTILFFGGAQADAGLAGPKLAGAWEILGTPDPSACGPIDQFVNVTTIGADGTVTNVDPTVATAVGNSYRIGGNAFVIGFFGFVTPAPGLTFRYEVQATVGLVNPGEFSGKFRTIVADTNGIVPDCIYEGTITGNRLVPMPY